MNNSVKSIRLASLLFGLLLIAVPTTAQEAKFEFEFGEVISWDDILSGDKQAQPLNWINVNTNEDTWRVNKDGMLICSGLPIGVMRSEVQYENFIMRVEWRHMEPGGNSGIFAWSSAIPGDNRLPDGVEIQMLDLDWVKLNTRNGVEPPIAYVHGELFGVGGVTTQTDNPRGDRSKAIENRVKGHGQWNTYHVVAVDGVIKLAVNGKFVNGISHATQKKGYLMLESEGAEIHFRSLKVIELPPGVTSAEQIAPLLE